MGTKPTRKKQMTAQHILLVEDEVKLARFIELELQSEGYRVTVAHEIGIQIELSFTKICNE
jgi:DNA-binding response OmpR family regulator